MINFKNKQLKKNALHDQQGVVLLEALIAILLFSIGILSLVGLQANMTKNTTSTKFRGDASYIAQQRIGAMWANPASAATLVESSTAITALPGGLRTVTNPSPNVFQVTVGWTEPNETPAASDTTAPCLMKVAHCYTTLAVVVEN
ncbi:MAG: prepilin-type cleavage/methylation domain-containing protein [Methylophilaceae bacterium]